MVAWEQAFEEMERVEVESRRLAEELEAFGKGRLQRKIR